MNVAIGGETLISECRYRWGDIRNYDDVGRNAIASRQMKMAASLTHDIKRQVMKLSFDSAAEITEEMSTNVSQFISLLQLHVNSFR